MVYRLWLWQLPEAMMHPQSSLQPKEHLCKRGLGSYMVRVDYSAIVTIVMMEIFSQ